MAWESLHNESTVNSGLEYFTALFHVPMAYNIFTHILLKEMAFDTCLYEYIHHIQGLKH